ncbi:MAG TPA: cation:proton antiporter [Burkholderiaceae bacterium]|nr:cation:proton antiporter [Burkholderiaceae bacterium]
MPTNIVPVFAFESINAPMLFGAILIAGLVADRLFSALRFVPRITIYLLIGLLIGPGALGWLDAGSLATARVFADIAIALLLFELGRYLDLAWIGRERWLLLTSVAEGVLTFCFVAAALVALNVNWQTAVTGALIAIATAPAVVMSVVRDVGADGNVTKRLLAMTAMNNILALVGLHALLPVLRAMAAPDATQATSWLQEWVDTLGPPVVMFIGGLVAGWLAARLTLLLAALLGKDRDSHFALLIAALVFVVGVAHQFNLSVLVAVLAFAVFSKNLDRQRFLLEPDFDKARRVFSILLFVVVGASLSLSEVALYAPAIAALVGARLVAKVLATTLFARPARVRLRNAALLGLALSPMAEVALSVSTLYAAMLPQVGPTLLPVIAGAVVVSEIAGPVLTQLALRLAGEARGDTLLGRLP